MLRHRIHVLLRLLDCDARLQPPHHQQPVEVVVHLLRLKDQRHGQLLLPVIPDPRLLHAYHGVRLSVQANRRSNDVLVRAQLHPQLVRQHRDVILPLHSFFRQEVPPQESRLADHLQHLRRLQPRLQIFRLILRRRVEARAGPRAQVREDRRLVLPVRVVACRNSVVEVLDLRPHHHQLVRVRIRQRRQQRRIVHREDRRVRADPQRQRQQHREGHARIPSQHPQTESKVPPQRLHPTSCLSPDPLGSLW